MTSRLHATCSSMASKIAVRFQQGRSGVRRERLLENVELEMAEIRDGQSVPVPVAQDPSQRRSRKLQFLGMFLSLLSSVSFAIFGLLVKLAESIPTFEGVLIRFQLQMIFSLPLMIYKRDQFVYPLGTTKFLVLRGITGGSAMCCKFYAFKNLALGDATALMFTSPVFTAIFGFIFLKESLSKFHILAAVFSLVGVTLIARPAFLFGSSLGNTSSKSEVLAISVALAGAVLAAASIVLTRKIVGFVRPRVVVLYMAITGSTVALGTALATGEGFKSPDCGSFDNWYLLFFGILGYCGQMLQTKALALEKAAICSVIRTSDILFSFILQILFLKEVVDGFSIGGAVLVTFCNVSLCKSFCKDKKKMRSIYI